MEKISINTHQIEKLILQDKFKETLDELKTFISKQIAGSDLESLMLRSNFRTLQGEFTTYSFQQKTKNNKEELSILKENLKSKLKTFIHKLT